MSLKLYQSLLTHSNKTAFEQNKLEHEKHLISKSSVPTTPNQKIMVQPRQFKERSQERLESDTKKELTSDSDFALTIQSGKNQLHFEVTSDEN
ncbi:hypothetical protein SS50377_24540 [Spironucleus salmonicida]|uniref:Uncharacterized protein n=1 Tax=Spironucleus salmonicida TaxID=348837 RepID=V6LNU9_9EUKA|nr:hypothetical protein SS50377_24540 [Spironucleus salmonicida]|eukprot:EST45918.1 Hypothetical protein SS50377_13894 [Spironucleus salmonicida]